MPGPCLRCRRQVYSAEERLALGRSWHQECFTCAVCNKSLDSTNLAENQENQEIYCKNCYRILYGTKGYGYGPNEPTLIANSGPLEECYDVTPTNSKTELQQFHGKNTAVVVKPFEQIPFRKGFLYWGRHPTPKHYGHQVVPAGPRFLKKCDPLDDSSAWSNCTPQKPKSFIQRPNPPPNCQRLSNQNCQGLPTEKGLPTENCYDSPTQNCQRLSTKNCQGLSTQNCQGLSKQRNPKMYNHSLSRSTPTYQGAEHCARCGKPVYFAERKSGYHGVYHNRCYVCCSCGKSLETTTVSESGGNLYCTGCYKRYIATAGVGYGIGAGTLQTH